MEVLPTHSMFSGTPVYGGETLDIDGETTSVVSFGLRNSVVSRHQSDKLHTVQLWGKNRLDLISYDAYETPDLWWVIADVNGIQDPMVGVDVGDVLLIPDIQRLSSLGVILN